MKAAGFKMVLDTKDFNKVLDDYMVFQKRTPADVINGKLFYIARHATMTTKHADKEAIESELRGPSRDYPNVPLGAILVNKQLREQGKSGVSGESMTKAFEKLIKKRKQSVNFVRAGWKNAILMLESYMRSKGELQFVNRWKSTAPLDKETMKKKGHEKLGKATVARVERGPRVWGEIQNDVSGTEGKGDKARLHQVKQDGLQKAVDKEVASMRIYLERKLNPVHQDFNKKMGYR
jgi:hypothetical protein